MLQLLQNLGTGETLLATVPAPLVSPGHLLIATSRTLVSAGTERMLVDFGRASLLDKARQQPEKVKMVLDKVRTDGLFATLDAVRSKLDQPLKVWSSFPATIEAVPGDPNAKGKTSLVCKITLPPEAMCGVGACVSTGATGCVGGTVVDSLCLNSKAQRQLTRVRAQRDSLRQWLAGGKPAIRAVCSSFLRSLMVVSISS